MIVSYYHATNEKRLVIRDKEIHFVGDSEHKNFMLLEKSTLSYQVISTDPRVVHVYCRLTILLF